MRSTPDLAAPDIQLSFADVPYHPPTMPGPANGYTILEWGVESIRACSVCDGPIDPARFRQQWISLRVATDVLPLLVNACSTACVQALPQPAEGYVPVAHQGGREVQQPEPHW